ncbi:MAG: hypothetical protein ACM3XN_01845 [Chloroflexota bacterium]
MLTARRPALPLAVIVHPRTVADVARRFGWIRHIPPRLAERALPLLPPFTITTMKYTAGDRETEVAFIACTATSAQIRDGRGDPAAKLTACLRLAVDNGAHLVALSGYLGSVHRKPGPTWTAGEDGKLLLAFWALRAVARLIGQPLMLSRVTVVSATEPAGVVMAHLVAREAAELVLVDRPGPRLDRLAADILDKTGTAAILAPSLPPSGNRLVVAGGPRAAGFLTDAASVVSDQLHRSVILDLGRPPYLSAIECGGFVFHGGAARLPDYLALPPELGFPNRTACGAITEGLLLALNGERPRRKDGQPTLSGCDHIASLARRHDIEFGALMRDNAIIAWRDVRNELPGTVANDRLLQ